MTISVIVPCRNERQYICEFLNSVLNQDLDIGWQLEILVADGSSDDGTREALGNYIARVPNVAVIDNRDRIVSKGLNAAIAAARGEIILRMDVHTAYAPDYIRECVKALRETGADSVGGPWVARGRGLVGEAIAAAFRSPFCVGGGKAHDPDYDGEVDTVYLGCWHRSVFDRAGLFDENLVRNQDDEFNFRLRKRGGRIWQSRRIKSWYSPRSSLRSLFRQYLQYGFWKVAVIEKHRGLASWRHAAPVLFISWILLSVAAIGVAAAAHMSALAVTVGAALIIGVSVYLTACIAASLRFSRVLRPGSLLILPGVIAVYHLAYGLGFLLGVLTFARNRIDNTLPGESFTMLTR